MHYDTRPGGFFLSTFRHESSLANRGPAFGHLRPGTGSFGHQLVRTRAFDAVAIDALLA